MVGGCPLGAHAESVLSGIRLGPHVRVVALTDWANANL